MNEKLYRIKPLVWEEEDIGIGEMHQAKSVFGTLNVCRYYADGDDPERFVFEYCVVEYYDEGSEEVYSIKAGKAMAEKFVRDRLAAALEEVEQPKKGSE